MGARARSKCAAVVAAARHAWAGYEALAMGADELQPLTRRGKDPFGGLGATVVDALDTLWMLGLRAEFGRARDWVADALSFDRRAPVKQAPVAEPRIASATESQSQDV